ncbi:hypothetical protein CCR75_009565 [Bremia lactucae]|uniref:Uncharacterized protein n=1 Tax=Bremia lactucae TaxID=4779 RepID=A0A976ILJ9_BRELC|nr:hypothetical protein CCR75_009565 [Bremia lactucae]
MIPCEFVVLSVAIVLVLLLALKLYTMKTSASRAIANQPPPAFTVVEINNLTSMDQINYLSSYTSKALLLSPIAEEIRASQVSTLSYVGLSDVVMPSLESPVVLVSPFDGAQVAALPPVRFV